MKQVHLPRASRLAAAIAVALSSPLAMSQSPAPKPDEQKVEKVEVTGSRIASPNVESVSPITTIDAAAIKVEGLRSVENLLNNLPQVFADQGSNVSNGATGTANVNLRGLGPDRTLVLINGRRMPAGSPRAFAADLNQIPAALVKRIEVLTGGGGAVYGSDAVAGVVNFIMNDRFEGVQIEANHSFFQHEQHDTSGVAEMIAVRGRTNPSQFQLPGDKSADGKITDWNLLLGGNFANNKGNATVFFSYKKEDALLQSERDFSACSIGAATSRVNNTINGVTFGPGFRCGGSGTSFPGLFVVAAGLRTVADAAGNVRPFVAATDQYNFGPTNFFQRPSERYGFNAYANYAVSDAAKVYSEFSFHDDRSVAQIAPSGLFGLDLSGPNALQCNNPLLSAGWRGALGCVGTTGTADAFILRRNVEGGGRQDDIRHTSYRLVLGVKGEFGKAWNYDLYAYDAKVAYQEVYRNDFSISRAFLALDVVPDANGNPVCRSGPPCVPYNLWRLGGVTPEALGYIQAPGLQRGDTQQKVQGGTISADLSDYGWKLPSAKSGIGVLFGLERRVEKLNLETDTAFTTGDLFGQGGTTIGLGGKYDVTDVFLETRVPILEGAPMAEMLALNGSYRRSDYSTGNKSDTFGFGAEWAPNKLVRLRASAQRAVRAPNVIELFTARGLSLFDIANDPCGAGGTATIEQCRRTGLPDTLFRNAFLNSPAGQYNFLGGGNPNLSPEESDSATLGLVLTPIRNMSIAIDYFSVEVEKVIGIIPPLTILNQCLEGNTALCAIVQRDRFGSLWATPQGFITSGNQNLGGLSTKGIDVEINYAMKIGGWGGLKFNFNGTKLMENITEPVPGLGSFDCAGLHGLICRVPSPEWRHKLRTTWETPWNVDISATWRHIASVNDQGVSEAPQLRNAILADKDRTLGQRDYLDISASWQATKQLALRGGINNVFDRDPPLSGLVPTGFGNGNTYPQMYDSLGRRIFFNATYKF